MESFGVLEGYVLSNRYRGLKKGLLRMTRYEGVGFDPLSSSGTVFLDGFDCAAKFDMLIGMGKGDIQQYSPLSLKPFGRNVKCASLELANLADHLPETIPAVFKLIMSLFESGVLNAIQPVTIITICRITAKRLYYRSRCMASMI